MQTVADKLAEWLAEKGVTHAFGVIGAGNLAIWDAITRLAKTEIICCHHEQAAATAAAGFNRIRGSLEANAICTSGGGSTNILTGAFSAYTDSIPLIIISGNEPLKYLRGDARVLGVQGFDTVEAVLPFVKDAMRFSYWHTQDMDDMYALAMRPRRGPVWLDFPRDVQTSEARDA